MTTSPRRRRALVCVPLAAIGVAATAITAQPAAALDLPASPVGFQDGVYVPIDDVVLTGNGDASVVANGNISVTWAGSSFEATVRDETEGGEGEEDTEPTAADLTSFAADAGLRGAVSLDLLASAAGSLDTTLDVLTMPLASIPAGPVTVTPYLGVGIHVAGEAAAGAEVSLVAPFNVKAALSKNDGERPHADTLETPSFRPEVGLPDAADALAFDVAVTVDVTVTFMVSIEGFPVGGPAIVASAGVDLGLAPGALDLDAIVAFQYGWSLPGLDGAPEAADPLRPLGPTHRVDLLDGDLALPDLVSTRWSRAFDIFNQDLPADVVRDGDELVVIEDGPLPWMARLDGLGHPEGQQTGSQRNGVDAFARTGGGDLVTATVFTEGVRVERYAADGTPIWGREIAVDDLQLLEFWSSVLPAADGGTILAGKATHIGGEERVMLIGIDRAGDEAWVTELDPPVPYTDLQVNDAAVMPDGDVLVVGYARHELDSAHEQNDALIVRVDPSGVVRAAFSLGGPRGDRANAVAVQPDGSFAISGETVVGSTAQPWVAVLTTDEHGAPTLRSSSHYLDEPANELPSAYSIATGITAVDGGDFVVAGYTGLHGHRDSWLMRVDPSGMPVWSKRFIGTEDDELTGVIAMDHGVTAFGHTRSSDPDGSFDDIWIVRSNVDGMVHFADDSSFETVNGDVQWQFAADHQLLELSMSPSSPAFAVAITDTTVTTSPAQAVERDLT